MCKRICVIPARLQASRLPRKLLAPLGGKPLIQWAFEGAKSVSLFDEVVVAVDHKELFECVENFGGRVVYTSPDCISGTDRLVELQKRGKFQADLWVNWQGDEPFITEETIQTLLQGSDWGQIWTLKKKITASEELSSSHVVKVVCDARGKALYFSRSCIPSSGEGVYKHIGLYAYTSEALKKIGGLSPCELEAQEGLEQLRFLYHGLDIQVFETDQEIFGIDTKEELAIAERLCYDSARI